MTTADIQKLETHLQRFKTEKSFDLVGLDGFLHGVTCLSKPVNPTQWIMMALTEESLNLNAEQATEIIGLTFAYYNHLAVPQHLQNQTIPIRCDGSVAQTVTWLRGFARAFVLDKEALQYLVYSKEEEKSRYGMLLFSQMIRTDEVEQFDLEPSEATNIHEAYLHTIEQFENKSAKDNIKALEIIKKIARDYLKSYKPSSSFEDNFIGNFSFPMGDSTPFRRDAKKVGRNEPCPCGSGKNFKHCHGR